MMVKFKINPLLIALGLSCLSVNSWALLHSPKLDVKSVKGDNITALVSFPAPVTGDLYLVTQYGGQFHYIGPGTAVTTEKVPYLKNSNFTADITVLDAPSTGIAPGVYPLYQVVTPTGADPLLAKNWMSGLSHIDFIVNVANSVPTPIPVTAATPTPTPTNVPAVIAPTPVPTLTPTPVPPVTTPVSIDGKAKYKSLGCSSGGCHKADPAANSNKVLNGKSVASLKEAIKKNPGDMGYLEKTTDSQFASDADLQAIADYLSTF